jgi:hypothetical protein
LNSSCWAFFVIARASSSGSIEMRWAYPDCLGLLGERRDYAREWRAAALNSSAGS